MSPSTSSEPIERGWDESWYWVRMENFQASFLPSDGEDLDKVCSVDVFEQQSAEQQVSTHQQLALFIRTELGTFVCTPTG